jgi:hypothetical protein
VLRPPPPPTPPVYPLVTFSVGTHMVHGNTGKKVDTREACDWITHMLGFNPSNRCAIKQQLRAQHPVKVNKSTSHHH